MGGMTEAKGASEHLRRGEGRRDEEASNIQLYLNY